MQECSSLEHTYGTSIMLQDRRLQYHISVCVHNWSCVVSHFLTFCRSTEWTSRVSHAQVVCITFRTEPYVIFRFMHLLFIKSWHVWVKARHLGLERDLMGIWICLKLVQFNEIHMLPPPKVLEESELSCRQSCAFILFDCVPVSRVSSFNRIWRHRVHGVVICIQCEWVRRKGCLL